MKLCSFVPSELFVSYVFLTKSSQLKTQSTLLMYQVKEVENYSLNFVEYKFVKKGISKITWRTGVTCCNLLYVFETFSHRPVKKSFFCKRLYKIRRLASNCYFCDMLNRWVLGITISEWSFTAFIYFLVFSLNMIPIELV